MLSGCRRSAAASDVPDHLLACSGAAGSVEQLAGARDIPGCYVVVLVEEHS
jgi:hypothetical protein